MITLKVDKDLRFDRYWDDAIEDYKRAIKAILEEFGYPVIKINHSVSSSGRGLHFWVLIDSEDGISDEEKNKLQFLLGDDETRVMINHKRISTGG